MGSLSFFPEDFTLLKKSIEEKLAQMRQHNEIKSILGWIEWRNTSVLYKSDPCFQKFTPIWTTKSLYKFLLEASSLTTYHGILLDSVSCKLKIYMHTLQL